VDNVPKLLANPQQNPPRLAAGSFTLFDVSGSKFELEKLLGIKVDPVSKDYLKPGIKKRILQESVRIL
jgi:predicted nucleotidyltransferase